ncbi:MAG: SpoIIE family protein phosphatase [Lachnospiraceae bacterium]|nr:SpoIIE family protein phosphatase [Lachnospiraceae bacterium]
MKTKRSSIRKRLQLLGYVISIVAVLLNSIMAVGIMHIIRRQSETALAEETRVNLKNIAGNKAYAVEAYLIRYREYAQAFAGYLSQIYADPDDYLPRMNMTKHDPVTDPRNEKYGLAAVRRTGDILVSDHYDELRLTGNVEDLIYPIISDRSKNVSAIYWGNEKGILAGYEPVDNMAPEDGVYDFFEVSWYKKCKEAGNTIFTDIYNDGFGRGLTVTCASPYYDAEGRFYGVFGVDVLISDLYRSSVALNLGEGAYAFLVDNNGNVISADGNAMPLTKSEGIDEETAARLLSDTHPAFLNNRIYYCSAPVESTGWTLCLHVPQELAMAPVKSIDTGIRNLIIAFIMIFILILILEYFSIRRLAERLTAPLLTLTSDVKEISSGHLDYRVSIESNDEISDLAESFNEMSASLQAHIHDLTKLTAETERLNTELSIATHIQSGMLPTNFPKWKNINLHASMQPAREVGGDFYDFFFINPDNLALVMADVSGKGVPAALFMVITKTLLKNSVLTGRTPAHVLEDTNRHLCQNNDSELFVTAWLGILNLKSGVLSYANAGHEYPALKHAQGDYELMMEESFPPLAAMEDTRYKANNICLLPGDKLFLYTDGLPDAKNPAGKRYGISAMLETMNRHASLMPEEFLAAIKKDIDSYAEGAEPFDDLTMLSLLYSG